MRYCQLINNQKSFKNLRALLRCCYILSKINNFFSFFRLKIDLTVGATIVDIITLGRHTELDLSRLPKVQSRQLKKENLHNFSAIPTAPSPFNGLSQGRIKIQINFCNSVFVDKCSILIKAAGQHLSTIFPPAPSHSER